jgi:hypothetical protein
MTMGKRAQMTAENALMKKLACLMAAFVLFFSGRSAEAQSIVWEIKQHSRDPIDFNAEINSKLESGFVPAGLSCSGKDVYILYVQGVNVSVSGWRLEGYATAQEMEAAVAARVKEGFFPAGISRTEEKLYIFFIKTGMPMGEWKIISTTPEIGDVESNVRSFVEKGYVPAGVTFFKDEYWTLVIAGSPVKPDKWLIDVYDASDFKEKINRNIERGFVPWGFEYSGGKRIDILYLGFSSSPVPAAPAAQ